MSRKAKYPLRDMAVGETRLFLDTDANKLAKRYWMYPAMRFRSRTVMVRGQVAARTERLS